MAAQEKRNRPRKSLRLTKRIVKEALHANRGNISATARALDVDRRTIYKWIEKDASVRKEREIARGSLIDIAQAQLTKAILAGDVTAIKFCLDRLGKHDGWSHHSITELTGAGGEPLFAGMLTAETLEYLKLQKRDPNHILTEVAAALNAKVAAENGSDDAD